MRSWYDEIYNSITSGQKKQAYRQMKLLPCETSMDNLLNYFEHDLNQPEMALKAAKIFINYSTME